MFNKRRTDPTKCDKGCMLVSWHHNPGPDFNPHCCTRLTIEQELLTLPSPQGFNPEVF